jgi:hypothetical protein|uniref:Uncharacterized protein n=1 Tax=Myoviridae sp. ctKFg29 TaxID=2827675 RepID=A0A8S5RYL0_9CAUD|nr:MAG TPA: hypothetical protein [Myoviridae sp. ctKFg29]
MKADGEYISRAALLEHLARCKRSEDATTLTASVIAALQCFIQSQPAADVAPVVRCKDCAHCGNLLRDGLHACCLYVMPYCRPDDFCSRGVRKDV